jgi:hypothetical protein
VVITPLLPQSKSDEHRHTISAKRPLRAKVVATNVMAIRSFVALKKSSGAFAH